MRSSGEIASDAGAVVRSVQMSSRRSDTTALVTPEQRSMAAASVTAASAPIHADRSGQRRSRRCNGNGRRVGVSACDRVGNLEPCVADVAEPLVSVLLQAPPQEAPNGRWGRGRERAEVDVARQHRGENIRNVITSKRPPPRQRLVERQPKAQISVRLSTGLPRACSGDMYAAVPRIIPGVSSRAT